MMIQCMGLINGRDIFDSDAFTYEKVNNTTYRICASFDEVPSDTAQSFEGYPYKRFVIENTGETCFDIEATENIHRKDNFVVC